MIRPRRPSSAAAAHYRATPHLVHSRRGLCRQARSQHLAETGQCPAGCETLSGMWNPPGAAIQVVAFMFSRLG